MVSLILSATLQGLEVEFIRVEVDVSKGLPVFYMVGYLSSEVKEAGERVRTAIRNIGINLKPQRIIVNLSPANVRKRGASFDLPIATAILISFGVVPGNIWQEVLIIGELGLDGRVQKVPGILPIALAAKERGCHTCIVPKDNEAEGRLVTGIRIIGCSHIEELIAYGKNPAQFTKKEYKEKMVIEKNANIDFCDIQGQETIKRAAEIAVAGKHNLLMMGPPGVGKSMIARRVSTIMPSLTLEESMEVSKIYSIKGLLKTHEPLIRQAPFRQVHHTVTKSALIGGGRIPTPGEISLANEGILMLDELAEFHTSVLEVLREPLEQQSIQISRSTGNCVFPADFILIAAANPCACGNYPDYNKCTCTSNEVSAYMKKFSQPFLSRIDLCVEVPNIGYEELVERKKGEPSSVIRKRVCKAREVQLERYAKETIKTNGRLLAKGLENYCKLEDEGKKIMEQAFKRLGLNARTYHKTLRVARTIADLEGEEVIKSPHLREAISYRMFEKG